MEWALNHWIEIGQALALLDIIVGALPDKVAKYPGMILTVMHKLYMFGKIPTKRKIWKG